MLAAIRELSASLRNPMISVSDLYCRGPTVGEDRRRATVRGSSMSHHRRRKM